MADGGLPLPGANAIEAGSVDVPWLDILFLWGGA